MTENNCSWTQFFSILHRCATCRWRGYPSLRESQCLKLNNLSLHSFTNNMHKGTWVFLSCLNYDSFSDSQPIFINCHKINHFPPMCSFLYFPPAYPIPSLFVFSSSFFCWSPFCFRLLFITLQRPPSHYSFLIPCSTEKSATARLLLKKWKDAADSVQQKTCGTMRAEGGFTACVKIWAGLIFL